VLHLQRCPHPSYARSARNPPHKPPLQNSLCCTYKDLCQSHATRTRHTPHAHATRHTPHATRSQPTQAIPTAASVQTSGGNASSLLILRPWRRTQRCAMTAPSGNDADPTTNHGACHPRKLPPRYPATPPRSLAPPPRRQKGRLLLARRQPMAAPPAPPRNTWQHPAAPLRRTRATSWKQLPTGRLGARYVECVCVYPHAHFVYADTHFVRAHAEKDCISAENRAHIAGKRDGDHRQKSLTSPAKALGRLCRFRPPPLTI